MKISTENKIAVVAVAITVLSMASGTLAALSLEGKATTNCTAVRNCNHGRPY
ncbi:MAG: hypothetical protein AAFW70_09110 [Cyanobacteria bacterium J06635_10]